MQAITPYILPVKGIMTRLPEKEKIYRLYECDDIFINAKVCKGNEEMKSKILDFYRKIGGDNNDSQEAILENFFYEKIFIYSENHKMIIDLFNNDIIILDKDKTYFEISSENKKEMDYVLKLGDYLEFGISWLHKTHGKFHITIDLYKNPQINSFIKILSSVKDNSTGLLVKNYNPEDFIVNSIDKLKANHINKNSKIKLPDENIFSKNDAFELFIKRKL